LRVNLSLRRNTIAAGILACAAAVCTFAVTTIPPEILIHLDGDYLHIELPRFDFLNGKPLDRLRDGASVAFLGQLTVTTAPNSIVPAARTVARFAFSYDIWEQRFSVTRLGDRPESSRSISHLSAQAAQNWCIENLAIERSQVPADKQFWVQLDLRVEDPRDQSGIVGEPGINITRLIEIFGRPAHSQQRWLLNGGPFRLDDVRKDDLKKLESRGPHG
jgi:hypothetical protein